MAKLTPAFLRAQPPDALAALEAIRTDTIPDGSWVVDGAGEGWRRWLVTFKGVADGPPQPAAPAKPVQRPAARAIATVARRTAPDLSCVHRGGQVAERACGTCRGTVQIRIFGCEVHGTCSLVKPVGSQVCATCRDRTPPPVHK